MAIAIDLKTISAGASRYVKIGLDRELSGSEVLSGTPTVTEYAWELDTATISKSAATITIPGHGLSVGDRVLFTERDTNTGIKDYALYYVKTVSGDAITVSLTSGGTAVTILNSGTAKTWIYKGATTGDLTITNKTINNVAAEEIEDATVDVNKVLKFFVSGQKAGTTYMLSISIATTASPTAETLAYMGELTCV